MPGEPETSHQVASWVRSGRELLVHRRYVVESPHCRDLLSVELRDLDIMHFHCVTSSRAGLQSRRDDVVTGREQLRDVAMIVRYEAQKSREACFDHASPAVIHDLPGVGIHGICGEESRRFCRMMSVDRVGQLLEDALVHSLALVVCTASVASVAGF